MVSEGDELNVELLSSGKIVEFEPLLVISDSKISIGNPKVTGGKVKAEVLEQVVKDPKVMAIRYKAKKRVHKVKGHRQQKTHIKILNIS